MATAVFTFSYCPVASSILSESWTSIFPISDFRFPISLPIPSVDSESAV